MTDPAVVGAHLHRARLAPYLEHAGDDLPAALRLYEWNADIAGAWHQVLGHCEVVLRNTISDALTAWNAPGIAVPEHSSWLINPRPPLKKLTDRTRSTAYDMAQRAAAHRPPNHRRHGHTITHDDLLAQCTFGTWSHLLPTANRRSSTYAARRKLWDNGLREAFPNLSNDPHGHATADRVMRLHRLRNRVAHHEHLLDVAHHDRLTKDALALLNSINPHVRDWCAVQSRIGELIVQRPPMATATNYRP